jgi:chemotaxis protein MotB
MSRRRRHSEEHENHERWLVSYADFITLLFAFFVVMYSISSVNEGKYRVLSETLSAVFVATPTADDPIQIGERLRELATDDSTPLAPSMLAGASGEATEASTHVGDGTQDKPRDGPAQGPEDGAADSGADEAPFERFGRDGAATRAIDEITLAMQEYLDGDLMQINRVGDRIEIEMKEQMLFPSGTARLTPEALKPLRALAESLKRLPSHLQIEGHTDNIPIATADFPSNWELSAARAASVVHYLARQGIEPYRLAAVGLGEHRPIADNETARGRAANRRVTVVILTGKRDAAPVMDEEVPWAEGPAVRSP